MTTITLNKTDIKGFGLDTIRVNGRKLPAGRFEQIAKTGNGKWQGKASGYGFTIIGGLESGGARHEWLVQWELDGKHDFVRVNSAVEAVNWINKQ